MPTITVSAFAGSIPRTSKRLVEIQNASDCVNCDLSSGSLRALKAPGKVKDLDKPALTIFKHDIDGWLTWDKDVNVVKSAVIDAEGEKPLGQLLVTGDRPYPTMYLSGGEVYRLGIPRPENALTVTTKTDAILLETEGRVWSVTAISAAPMRYGNDLDLMGIVQDSDTAEVSALARTRIEGLNADGSGEDSVAGDGGDGGEGGDDKDDITDSGIQRSTSYLYTYVQELAGGVIKYEGAPSPASEIVDVLDNDGVVLTGFVIPKLPDLKITHVRIYRTVSGLTTSDFRFLAEISVVDLEAAGWQYTDVAHDKDVSTEVLQTTIWDEIPDNAQGLINTDNGIYAAFRGNELLISEPFIPYAFPASYRLMVEDTIVALAHVDGTIVVLTTGRPYLAQGNVPESLALSHLPIEQSCVSAASVANIPGAVIYASPDGLMMFTSNEQNLITAQTFSRDQWQDLGPSRLLGAVHENRYIGFFKGTNTGLMFSIGRADVVRLELDDGWEVNDLYHHSEDDALYLSVKSGDGSNAIWKFEADGSGLLTYSWHSKDFFISTLTSMSAARVQGEVSKVSSVKLDVFGPDRSKERQSITLTGEKAVRIRPTRSERIWSFKLTGTAEIHEARFGGSVEGVEYGQ